MPDRQRRLDRVVSLLQTLQRVHEARAARLAGEESAARSRQARLLELAGAGGGQNLQRAAGQRVASLARESVERQAELDRENDMRLAAKRRATTAERALERLKAQAGERTQRRVLEEIGSASAASPVSRKVGTAKGRRLE